MSLTASNWISIIATSISIGIVVWLFITSLRIKETHRDGTSILLFRLLLPKRNILPDYNSLHSGTFPVFDL